MPAHQGPLLLYDAHCSVCRRFVQWFIHADAAGRLRIAPLQGGYGDAVRRDYTGFAARDSAIWIPEGEGGIPVHRSGAVLGVMQYLGGLWGIAAALGRLVPRPFRDWVYRTFAGNRRYFGWMGLDAFDARTLSRILPDLPPDA
jgi:predicted DCC family thiol-disulfide oxidoreductase YuxK